MQQKRCSVGPTEGKLRCNPVGYWHEVSIAVFHFRTGTFSRTLKVRGGIIPQADRYLVGFCSSQRIFPPQTIQVLLKLCYYRVFNLILWVLYTGMQWKCLLLSTDDQGNPANHYTTDSKVIAMWAGY